MGKESKEKLNIIEDIHEKPYSSWEIRMTIDKPINVDRVVNFLKANNIWAYVYIKQHHAQRIYYLNGYIMLRWPENEDWWRQHLGDHNQYVPIDEHPNAYRMRHMYQISHPNEYPFYKNYPNEHPFWILIKIDKGPYFDHRQIFTPRVGGEYFCIITER